jgi:hypothetical protein
MPSNIQIKMVLYMFQALVILFKLHLKCLSTIENFEPPLNFFVKVDWNCEGKYIPFAVIFVFGLYDPGPGFLKYE